MVSCLWVFISKSDMCDLVGGIQSEHGKYSCDMARPIWQALELALLLISQENYTSLPPTHTGLHVVTVLMIKKIKSHFYGLLHFTSRLILSYDF